MVDTVKTAVDRCSKGADPSKVVAELAIEKDMTTEQAARICEAVNKIASINYLSDKNNDREADFPLANSAAVVKMMKDTYKIAKEPFKFRKTASEGLGNTNNTLDKMKYVTDEEKKRYEDSYARANYSAGWMDVQRDTQSLKLAADEERLATYKLHEDFIALANKCASLNDADAQDMANYTVYTYGKDGLNFLTALENLTERPYDKSYRPFMKTGSDVEKAIDQFMFNADQLMGLRDTLGVFKEASAKGGKNKNNSPSIEDPTALDMDSVIQMYANERGKAFLNEPREKQLTHPDFIKYYNNRVKAVKANTANQKAFHSGGSPYMNAADKATYETDKADWDLRKKQEALETEKARSATQKALDDWDFQKRQNAMDKEKAERQKEIEQADIDKEKKKIRENIFKSQFGDNYGSADKARARMDAEEEIWRHRDLAKQRRDKVWGEISKGSSAANKWLDDIKTEAINNVKSSYSAATGLFKYLDAARKALQGPQLSGNEYSNPLSLKASKYLDNLGLHDTFAKAYLSDPYLRQYSPKEVAEAFNIVHEVAPDIITKNASPHVVSAMIRKYLASNNQIDPIEVRDLVSTEKDRAQTDLTKQQLENLKRTKPNK